MAVNNYQQYYDEYLGIFEPLFRKAFATSEFNVVMSLLAFRGSSDEGWEPFENTEDVFQEIGRQQSNFRYSLRTNMLLWLYVHIVECAENYELISNLLNTVHGTDYVIANNKNKNYVNLTVLQKIERLRLKASNTPYASVYTPFEDTFDSKFRNAIGHADYAVKRGQRSGITILGDSGDPRLYNDQETLDLLNRAIALQACIIALRAAYIRHYKKSVVIQSSSSFGGGRPVDVTLIVRKKHGVIGFRCIGGYDAGVPFETKITKPYRYEVKMIENGLNDLPPSRIDTANRIVRFLPRKFANKAAPFLEENFVNRQR